jgi:hypothetical protein
MKQSFLNSIKISALALIIGLGVSAVSAWTVPTVNPPATGTVKSPTNDTAKPVAAAINLSLFDQIKRGGITINTQKPPATADGKLVSPLSFFKKVLLPNVDTSVYIGGASFADPSFASSFPGNRDVPMTINLTGRAKINDAILFKTDAACPQPTKIINSSASAFEFWNTAKGENADLLANGIRLDGGNPAAGKILISVDNDGRAVWATPKLAANGTDIIFDTYSDSPVGVCGTPITYYWDIKWVGCKTTYDSTATENIDLGDSVEYGAATCKNSSNQTVPNSNCASLGAPWPDMDGVAPIRIAASSLTQCSTPNNSGSTDPIKLWYCHLDTGTWNDVTATYAYEGSCQAENYRQGYYHQSYVCSINKPADSNCLTDSEYDSGNYVPLVQGCSTATNCLN